MFFSNTSPCVVSINNFYYICDAVLSADIFIVKVFSHCPYKKMWKFSEQKGYDNTRCLFRFMWKAQFLRLCLISIQVWGIASFIFVRAFSTAFL